MATATMGVSSVDRLARSKRPTVERTEIHIPPAPVFPVEAVTGDPARRVQAVASFNNALQKWRNDAWSIEAPFVPDAALQADVATLENTTAKMSTKLDRAAIDIRLADENITTIETDITNIDNSITTINNQITVIGGSTITGSGIVQANGAAPPSAILGTPGYYPYWQAGDPNLSADSPIFTTPGGGLVGIGTTTPATVLHVYRLTTVINSVVDVFRVTHSTTNTPTAAFGTSLTFGGMSDATDDRDMGAIQTRWTTATDATRASAMDLQTVTAGGTLTTWATILSDGKTGIGTITPSVALHVKETDTATTGVLDLLRIERSISGTPAATFGTGIMLAGKSATVADRDMAHIQTRWTTATDATRKTAIDFQHLATSATQTLLTGFTIGGADATIEMTGYSTSTNSVFSLLKIYANTLGTAAAGLGGRLTFYADSDTTENLPQAAVGSMWTVATHATRMGALDLYAITTGSLTHYARLEPTRGCLVIGSSTTVTSIAPDAGTRLYVVNNGLTTFRLEATTANNTAQFQFIPSGTGTCLFNFGTAAGLNPFRIASIATNVGDVWRWEYDGRATNTANDSSNTSVVNVITHQHGIVSGGPTPTAGFGSGQLWQGDSSTTADRDMGRFRVLWTTATDATRTATMEWQTVDTAAALATRMALSGAGGLSVGDGTNTMPVGVINAVTGFRVNNIATSGQVLMGDGTNIVLQALPVSTHTILDAAVHTDTLTGAVTRGGMMIGNATPNWSLMTVGTFGQYVRSNGTDVAWSALQASEITGTIPVSIGGTNSTSFTAGSVIFAGAGGTSLTEDNSGFFWNDADNQLRVTRDDIRITQGAYGFLLSNSTPATASAALQQWSPPVIYEGQGWKTNAVAGTQKVQFRNYVATVIGAANPTAYFVTDYDVNASGTFTELTRVDSAGFLRILKSAIGGVDTTLAMSVYGLQLENATAATAPITRQDPPLLTFKGAAWNSFGAGSSEDWRFRIHQKGVTVAGTTRSYIRIDSGMNAAAFANPIIITSHGGLAVGALWDDTPNGIVNAQAGFRIANGATSGTFLRGNGTNFVQSAIQAGDISAAAMVHAMLSATHSDTLASAVSRGSLIVGNATPLWAELNIGAAARLLRSDGTDASWAQAVLTTDVTGVLPVANGGTNRSAGNNGAIAYYSSAGTLLEFSDTSLTYIPASDQILSITDQDAVWVALTLANLGNANDTSSGTSIALTLTSTGNFQTQGATLTAIKEQAWVGATADATQDGALDIATCLNGTATVGLTVRSSGSIICGKDSNGTTRTDDFTYICTSNGPPTGVPTGFGNRVPITFDPNTDTFYIYRGGWKGVVVL